MKPLAIALTVVIALTAAPVPGMPHTVLGVLALLLSLAITILLFLKKSDVSGGPGARCLRLSWKPRVPPKPR